VNFRTISQPRSKQPDFRRFSFLARLSSQRRRDAVVTPS